MGLTLPRPLRPGSAVGIMAPAGPASGAALRAGVRILEGWGLRVVRGPNTTGRRGYLAGDDEQRLAGVRTLLASGVEVLMAARGGYGTARLLADMPWDELRSWGGWVVGFSDLTALHCALAGRSFPVATLHGPMLTGLASDPVGRRRLQGWLTGQPPAVLFRFARERVVRGGRARGRAIGGNLSVLASLLGTPFEPPWPGSVLFLEDVGEPLYRLDRLLTQLRLASRLSAVTAVVAGTLVGCGRGEHAWRRRWRDLLAEAAPNAVVVEGAAFGHGSRNLAFPLGAAVEVDTGTGTVRLESEGRSG